MKLVLTPRELAEAIGVSESSLKRWADEGHITASKTAGGHRRISLHEAIRFIRATKAPLIRPEVLGLAKLSHLPLPLNEPTSQAEALYEHLREGRAQEARALITGLYVSGETAAAICDGPLRLALDHMGTLWEHSEHGIYLEHRATDICLQALQELRLLLPDAGGGPPAVGGAPSGDPYLLPSMAAATVLLSAGYRAINLGPETPLDSLLIAVEHQKPRLVWLSISVAQTAKMLAPDVERLGRSLAASETALIIGGREKGRLPAAIGQFAEFADSMEALAVFAENLSRKPSAQSHAPQNT